MDCVSYEWKKVGGQGESSLSTESTKLVLTSDTPYPNNATYQCFAGNGIATAMTNKTRLVMAVQAVFRSVQTAATVRATVGESCTVLCEPSRKNVPPATIENYEWRVDETKKDLDRRMQIDDSGMYFVFHGRPLSPVLHESLRPK